MALKITKTVPRFGLKSTPDMYARINHFSGHPPQNVSVNVQIFINEQARIDEKQPIEETNIHFPWPEDNLMPGDNIIQWCYVQLKKEDEFKDGVDV